MFPTHPRAGTSKARQEVGGPGHCERCAEVGHVQAHPDLGCGDVGCNVPHSVADDLRGPDTRDDAEVPGTAAAMWEDRTLEVVGDLIDVLAELERLRARVAELDDAETVIRYGWRRPDGAMVPASPGESRRHVLDLASLSDDVAVQWEVHTWTGPVSEVSS
jgi:hypothetical protein